MDFENLLKIAIGAAVAILAGATIVWLMQFQFTLLAPDLFNVASPFGLLAIAAILVFCGFYLLHMGFETIYGAFRG